MGRFAKYVFLAALVPVSLSLSLLILYSSELQANSHDKAKVVWTATDPKAMIEALMEADGLAATTLSETSGETPDVGVVNKTLEVGVLNIKKTTGDDRATIRQKLPAQQLARFVNEIEAAKRNTETTTLRKRLLGIKQEELKLLQWTVRFEGGTPVKFETRALSPQDQQALIEFLKEL
jgi:hypothetical protein